jgi:ferredoxin--NADP+ reductase
MARVSPVMEAVGQDPEAAKQFILSGTFNAMPAVCNSSLRFMFLASPVKILGDPNGKVCGLEVENTTLTGEADRTKARGMGTTDILDVDTVIFCIGDKVDEEFGLPVRWNAFVKNPEPTYPVAGLSYEAYDAQTERPIRGVFVAGWSREASSGLVGVARKDGENGAQAVLLYLQQKDGGNDPRDVMSGLQKRLSGLMKPVITHAELEKITEAEDAEKEQRGLEEFKFESNTEMFEVIGAAV